MRREKVGSIEHLKEILSDGERRDFSILLNYELRSSKDIVYRKSDDLFCINNQIDDSHQDITPDQLFTESLIGEAIRCGVFVHNKEELPNAQEPKQHQDNR